MPTEPIVPRRKHSQHRRVEITFGFAWQNPNPPHIWDATDKDLEDLMIRVGQKHDVLETLKEALRLSIEGKKGMVNADFVEGSAFWLKVKARESGPGGKPLNFWGRLRYLLTGRYRW